MPLVSSVNTVYTAYYTTFAWRTGTIFPLVFYVENLFPVFWYTLPLAISETKSVVSNRAHQCVCSYSYLYYLHEHKLCRCARTTTPSRPGTQPLVRLLCGVFWRSNRIHYLLVLVMRALAMSIHVCTYLPKFSNKMHYYYDLMPTAVPWGFIYCTSYILFVSGQYDANLGRMSCHVSCNQPLHTHVHQDPKNNWRVPFKTHFFARFSLVSLSIRRVHVEVRNG